MVNNNNLDTLMNKRRKNCKPLYFLVISNKFVEFFKKIKTLALTFMILITLN